MNKSDWISLLVCIAVTWFAAAVVYRFRLFGVPVLVVAMGTVLWGFTRKVSRRHDRAA